MTTRLPPLKMYPETWVRQWMPAIQDTCRVTEAHGIFNAREVIVVEATIPATNMAYVSKLLEPMVKGQIPFAHLEQMN